MTEPTPEPFDEPETEVEQAEVPDAPGGEEAPPEPLTEPPAHPTEDEAG